MVTWMQWYLVFTISVTRTDFSLVLKFVHKSDQKPLRIHLQCVNWQKIKVQTKKPTEMSEKGAFVPRRRQSPFNRPFRISDHKKTKLYTKYGWSRDYFIYRCHANVEPIQTKPNTNATYTYKHKIAIARNTNYPLWRTHTTLPEWIQSIAVEIRTHTYTASHT